MTDRPRRSIIAIERDQELRNSILVSGLPGVGFVGNIAVVQLIKHLNAQKFGEVYSPYFQDLIYSSVEGSFRRPTIELYSYVQPKGDQDLILLYGNTQSLTSYGQYEVSGKVLDHVITLGCKTVVSLAGLRRDYVGEHPQVFCVASDLATMDDALSKGVGSLQGEVYGMAGMLVGLARLKGMHSLCLMAETLGIQPDPKAAGAVLERVSAVYGIQIDLSHLDETAEEVSKQIHSGGF